MTTSRQQHPEPREIRRRLSDVLHNKFGPAMMCVAIGTTFIILGIEGFTELYNLPVPVSTLSDDARVIFFSSQRNYQTLLLGLIFLVVGFIWLLVWLKSKYEIHLQDATQRTSQRNVDR
jgi:hypothetical protein